MEKKKENERLSKKTRSQKDADLKNLIKKGRKVYNMVDRLEDQWTEIKDCYMSDLVRLFNVNCRLSQAMDRCKEKYVSSEYREGATHEDVYK